MIRYRTPLLAVVALALSSLVGWLDLHSDDTFILVGLMAGAAASLGFVQPQAPWRWGILVGLGAPLAEVIAPLAHLAAPYAAAAVPLPGVLLILLLTVSIALVAAYAGALLRQAVAGAGSA